jgi:DNA polymerase I-like protein with 3'-5' exonuclease and polymerase domains
MPIKSTGKRGTPWDRVLSKPPYEQAKFAPSTDMESLKILASEHPELRLVAQWKTVDQLRKSFLRLPEGEDGDEASFEYLKGLGSWLDPDGKLRTRFRQTLETGRYSTSPNLQNWPKRTEPDIQKCFKREVYALVRDVPDIS